MMRISSPRLGYPALILRKGHTFTISLLVGEGKRLKDIGYFELVYQSTRQCEAKSCVRIPINILNVSRANNNEYRLSAEIPGGIETNSSERVVLYDLVHSSGVSAPNSVALYSHDFSSAHVMFAADIHVARIWDDIESEIEKLSERTTPVIDSLFSKDAFHDSFLNPNLNFTDLVEVANRKYKEGKLDLVILGGDLVDYVYSGFRGTEPDSYEKTNVSLFENIVLGKWCHGQRLRVPMLTVTGNHDYRLYPYQISTYGLRHCGLNDFQTMFLRNLKSKPGLSVPTMKDLWSVWARKSRINNSLKYYHWNINPKANFEVSFDKLLIVGLDTGRDALLNLFGTKLRRLLNLFASFRHGLSEPLSEGLSDSQCAMLEKCVSVSKGDVFVIFHSGMFNPSIKVSKHKRYSTCDKEGIALETQLHSDEVSVGTMLQNHGQVLAMAKKRRLLGLSGHIHRRLAVRVNGDEEMLQFITDPPVHVSPDESSYFLSAASVGHIQDNYPEPNHPGFWTITYKKNVLTDLKWEDLNPRGRFFTMAASPNDEVSQIQLILVAGPEFSKMENGALKYRINLVLIMGDCIQKEDKVLVHGSEVPEGKSFSVERVDKESAQRYFLTSSSVYLCRSTLSARRVTRATIALGELNIENVSLYVEIGRYEGGVWCRINGYWSPQRIPSLRQTTRC